jgi:hypothetical protein
MDGGDDDPTVRPLARLAIGFRDTVPDFATARRTEIAARWTAAVAGNPALFNGTVLLFEDLALGGDTLSATAVPVDYATFSALLAWRDDARLTNVFGAAAIMSADGDLLLGRMGAATDDAGTIKLVGGTPDMSDVRDGRVDILGSIGREMTEETGLRAEDAVASDGLLLVTDPPFCAVAQVLRFPQSTEALVRDIRAFLAGETDPELSGVAVARTRSDDVVLGSPRYTRAIARHLLPA